MTKQHRDDSLIIHFFATIYRNIFFKFSKKFSRENLDVYLKKAFEKYVRAKNLSKQKIIHIGTGGEATKLLKERNIKFCDVDIDKTKNPDLVLDIQNMYLIEDNSVDVIFCLEVLEHVTNPFKAIQEIKRVLKPQGLFIGSTPFVFPIHDEPHDYFRYTKYGILKLFENFECLELKEKNSYLRSIYVILVRLFVLSNFKQKIFAILLFPFILLCLPFLFLFDWLITNKQSTTGYFYVFRN